MGRGLRQLHNPIVVFLTEAFGSICHHLQSLHNPHSLMTFLLLIDLAFRNQFAVRIRWLHLQQIHRFEYGGNL